MADAQASQAVLDAAASLAAAAAAANPPVQQDEAGGEDPPQIPPAADPINPGPEGGGGGAAPPAQVLVDVALLQQILAGQQHVQIQMAALQQQQQQQPLVLGAPAGGALPLPLAADPAAPAGAPPAAAAVPGAPAGAQTPGAKIIEKKKAEYWNTSQGPMFFLLRGSADIGVAMDKSRLELLTKEVAHITNSRRNKSCPWRTSRSSISSLRLKPEAFPPPCRPKCISALSSVCSWS